MNIFDTIEEATAAGAKSNDRKAHPTGELVTDEVVEAATRANYDAMTSPGTWVKLDSELQDRTGERAAMREALEAAAPLIAAKAWEEGYQACRNRPRVDGYLINRANPYQTRADAIERSDS